MLNSTLKPKHSAAICIYFPCAYDPIERKRVYEAPLKKLLPKSLGYIDGGGTWLHGASDVWVFASDLTAVLPVIRKYLAEVGAPSGTQIQYEAANRPLHDELLDHQWSTERVTSNYTLGLAKAA